MSWLLFCIISLTGALAVPLEQRGFFWYPTDKGTIVPALLTGNPQATSRRAIEDDVVFWHYRINQEEGQVISPNCTNNCLSNFIKDAKTIFLAHGFGSDHVGGFGTSHRSGFANRSEPVNMVFINWSKLAASPWYERAADSVQPVGEYTAKMINFLLEQNLVTIDKIVYIGHSLGAHIGNYVSANVNGRLQQIFALDPALPLFGVKNDTERIDPTDAEFVNVLHTSMGTLLDGGLAFTEPRGHIDFYPNSGRKQPGCSNLDFGACSHSRSYRYLSESISNPTAFPACKCTDWDEFDSGDCSCTDSVYMGWDTPRSARGLYYLRTNSDPPYGESR